MRSARLVSFGYSWGTTAVYGVVIFLVMNWIVVPLSAYPYHPKITLYWTLANLAAMVIFGLMIAVVVRQLIGHNTTL